MLEKTPGVFAVFVAALIAVGGCASSQSAEPGLVRGWITSGDRSRLLAPQPPALLGAAGEAGDAIVVDPAQRFQSIVGFGAAVTDASAILIQTKLRPEARTALLSELFGRDGDGLGFSFTRVTVGASDFSPDHYSLADTADPTLAGFTTTRMEEHVFPTVRQALEINPELEVMASPWSAPGWMKTTGSLIQGSLKPEHYPTYADYWVRYIRAAEANGVPTDWLSIQNEPDFEPDSYPGMRWAPEGRAEFIGGHLGPRLRDEGIAAKILDWDHNWDKPEQPLAVLADARANPFVAGVAWHCYAGDVEAQTPVRDAYPDKDVFFTECSGGDWAPDWSDSFGWTFRTLIVGSTRHWSRGVLMWNLALDENHGPHTGGCGDCRGVVTIDSRTGEITRNQEYYAFGHASRFIRPGARRVASSAVEGIDSIAFVNPDGGRVLLAWNGGDVERTLLVGESGAQVSVALPAKSAGTWTWAPPSR